MAGATATINEAIGAGAVPGHADEERAVMPPVRRPPGLGIGHQGEQICLEAGVVQLLKFSGVIEAAAKRVGLRTVLVQQRQIQLIGPPLPAFALTRGGDSTHMSTERTFQLTHLLWANALLT